MVLCAAPGEGGPRSAGGSVCSVVCTEPRRALGAAGVCKSLSSAKAGRCSLMGSADPALQVRACPAVPQRVGVSPGPAPARPPWVFALCFLGGVMCWCPRGRLGKPGRVLSGMCLREVAWAGVRSVGQGSALLPRCGGWGAHAEPLSERCGFGRALSAFVIKLNKVNKGFLLPGFVLALIC